MKILVQEGGIAVVNSETKQVFLNYVKPRLIQSSELREMLKNINDFDEKLSFQESVLIDFDRMELINKYYEPNAFETMVPTGWTGRYSSFTKYVPEVDRFWIDECNNLMWDGYNEFEV